MTDRRQEDRPLPERIGMTPEETYRQECKKRGKRLPTGGELHKIIRHERAYEPKCPKCGSKVLVMNQPKPTYYKRHKRPRNTLKKIRVDCGNCGYSWRSESHIWLRWRREIPSGSMAGR
jgi:DNA-directed RNA polymerase subunit RPC12/RpoP